MNTKLVLKEKRQEILFDVVKIKEDLSAHAEKLKEELDIQDFELMEDMTGNQQTWWNYYMAVASAIGQLDSAISRIWI